MYKENNELYITKFEVKEDGDGYVTLNTTTIIGSKGILPVKRMRFSEIVTNILPKKYLVGIPFILNLA